MGSAIMHNKGVVRKRKRQGKDSGILDLFSLDTATPAGGTSYRFNKATYPSPSVPTDGVDPCHLLRLHPGPSCCGFRNINSAQSPFSNSIIAYILFHI